jgi:PhnB protein
MKAFQPYLNFDGNCREAMTFYHECIGGEFFINSFADANIPGPPGSENRTMHANIKRGTAVIMASDTMPTHPFSRGNNMHINVDCESREELDKLANALVQGGKFTMAPQDTFWGAYFAMLVDKFGVQWMFNFDTTQS